MRAIVCNQCKKIIEENIYHLEIQKPFGICLKPRHIPYTVGAVDYDRLDFCSKNCMFEFLDKGRKKK